MKNWVKKNVYSRNDTKIIVKGWISLSTVCGLTLQNLIKKSSL